MVLYGGNIMEDISVKKELNYSSLLIQANTTGQAIYREYDKLMYNGGDNFKELLMKTKRNTNKALIVNGSGDQPIEAIYQGFSTVDAFDINKLSRHMLNLKIAAIQAFSYEEFLTLFQTFLTPETFQKTIAFLPNESIIFFQGLFKNFSMDQIKKLFTHRYTHNSEHFLLKCQQNFSFYNEKEFYELKAKLLKSQVGFLSMDIFDKQLLFSKIQGPYDFIFLSNILFFAGIPIEQFLKENFPVLYNSLASGGVLAVHYFHSYALEDLKKKNVKNQKYQLKNMQLYQQLESICTDEILLNASGFGHGIGTKDLALVLKK